MRSKLGFITTFLAAGAAAAAIAAAPTALAGPAPVEQCVYLGVSETQCQTPGNVQINDNPAYVQDASQYPYWEGDSFHSFRHGRR